MNPIARFEAVCARAVEGTFARIFPSALEAAHVGRKLLAAQAATPTDTFLVRVHPVDYQRFARDRSFLEARWSALVREAAHGDAPHVVLHEDPEIVAGTVRIDPIVDERPTTLSLVRPDGAAVPLRDGLRIGRGDDNDVILRDGRVSRRHARVLAENGGFALEDLGSSNGTFADGEPVRRITLRPGMRLTLGETVLQIR